MSPSLTDSADVARWLRVVRRRLDELEAPPRGVRLRVTFGVCFWTLLATCTGPHPLPLLGVWLLLVMLLYEAPLLAWATAQGRLARITLTSDGAHTHLGGAPVPARQKLVLAFVGSAVCLLLGYALLPLARTLPGATPTQGARLQIFWGLVQLLPLVPFKLGCILRSHFTLGIRIAHASISLGASLAALAWFFDDLELPLVLVGFGIWLNARVQEVWQDRARWLDARANYAQRLSDIESLILSDQARKAIPIAREVLEAAHSAELRARAGKALAWAAIGAGDVAPAYEALARLPESQLDAHLVSAYLATVNRTPEAIALLTHAQRLGLRSRASSRLLADLYYRDCDAEALAALARSDVDLLDADELGRIEQALSLLRTRASQPPPKS